MRRHLPYLIRWISQFRHRLFTRLEPAILFGCLFFTVGIWIFAELSDDVLEGDFTSFDTYFMEAASLWSSNSPPWVRNAVIDLTAIGSFSVLSVVTILVAGFLIVAKKPRSAIYLTSAVAGGALLNSALKEIFARPRPDTAFPLLEEITSGFPSGHAATTAVVCLTLAAIVSTAIKSWALRTYILFSAIIISLLVGLTRIYLGVHYATDVLAGWTVGIVWSIGCWTVARLLQKRRSIEGVSGGQS